MNMIKWKVIWQIQLDVSALYFITPRLAELIALLQSPLVQKEGRRETYLPPEAFRRSQSHQGWVEVFVNWGFGVISGIGRESLLMLGTAVTLWGLIYWSTSIRLFRLYCCLCRCCLTWSKPVYWSILTASRTSRTIQTPLQSNRICTYGTPSMK